MIARPQADLLNMLPVTQVAPLAAKAMEAGVPRFDAALLEAAKMVRDGVPEKPELTLTPKVRQAFETALGQLSQKPLDQLKTLAQQPAAARTEINAVVEGTTQALGLNKEEAAALKQLVPLALPSVLAFKVQAQVPGTPVEIKRIDGVQPGPQGGTPVKTTSPADLIQDPKAGLQPKAPPVPAPEDGTTRATRSDVVPLAQSLPAPVLVSTRTDDGSASQGAVTLSRNNGVPAAAGNPDPVPQGTARVIQVLTSRQDPQAGTARPAQAPAPSPAPVATPTPQAPLAPPQNTAAPAPKAAAAPDVQRPNPAPAAVERGPVPSEPRTPSVAPQAKAPETAPAPRGPLAESGVAPRPEAPATAGKPPVALPDYQVLDAKGSVPVQAGSEVTLKEDGTWVLPKAEAPAVKAQAPLNSRGALPPPTPTPEAGRAIAPVQAPSQAPSQAPAPVAAAPAPAPQAAAQTVAPNAAAIPPPANLPVQAPPQAVAAEVKAAPAPQGPQAAAPAFAPDLREQAPVAATRRQAQDGAFQGLAQQGQDPLKALALQAARDYSVRESVFKQVSEALREAPDKESGRLLIRLKPAELGEVTVDLVIQGGKLSARLVASQAEVRDAFVRDLHSFKAGLESQGVVVKDVSVAVRAGVADQQQQPPPQQQAPWWRDLPPQSSTPVLSQPVLAGLAPGATDNRFSALA